MDNNNLQLWDRLKRPPPEALRQIQAGRLRGKTDINPQWRMKAMTEAFGVVGIGWKYTIDQLWTEAGTDGQVFAFARVSVYVRNGDAWGDPIPGVGGHFLVVKESSGLHNNDEAFKMATTDALSVAFKALGVAADVYANLWDGSKWREPSDPAPSSKTDDRPRTSTAAQPTGSWT